MDFSAGIWENAGFFIILQTRFAQRASSYYPLGQREKGVLCSTETAAPLSCILFDQHLFIFTFHWTSGRSCLQMDCEKQAKISKEKVWRWKLFPVKGKLTFWSWNLTVKNNENLLTWFDKIRYDSTLNGYSLIPSWWRDRPYETQQPAKGNNQQRC